MKYADHVTKEFGAEYVFEVGDRAVTARDVYSMCYCIKKGTVVTIIDVGARGYDLVDDRGRTVLEAGWTCLEHVVEA